MANFKGYGKIQAELSNGEVIECETSLTASGDYREWYEPAPVEYMYGWTEHEQEIDEDTIEVENSKDFECDAEYPEDVEIKSIIKVIDDIDWEVQEGWNEPDEDAQYEAWKDRQIA